MAITISVTLISGLTAPATPVNIILSTLKLEIKRVVDIAALTFPIPLSTNMTSFEHSFPS